MKNQRKTEAKNWTQFLTVYIKMQRFFQLFEAVHHITASKNALNTAEALECHKNRKKNQKIPKNSTKSPLFSRRIQNFKK